MPRDLKLEERFPDYKTLTEISNDPFLSASVIAFDVETHGLATKRERRLKTFALTVKYEGELYSKAWDVRIDPTAIPFLKSLLSDPSKLWVIHNVRFEFKVFNDYGISWWDLQYEDTLVMSSLLNRANNALKSRAKEVGIVYAPGEDYGAEGLKLYHYNMKDTEATYLIYEKFSREIKSKRLETIYALEKAVALPTVLMETTGMKFSAEEALDFQRKFVEIQDKKLAEIRDLMGADFNPASSVQLSGVLRPYFPKPPRKWLSKKTGKLSTGVAILQAMLVSGALPDAIKQLVEAILTLRRYTKLNSTYIKGVLEKLDGGKVYCELNPYSTATGRYSCSGPNLQNQPKGAVIDGSPDSIRKLYVPNDGYVFLDVDYSQIELRVHAHFSQSKLLIDSYNEGIDYHQVTADRLGISRFRAKSFNFGKLYGLTARNFAEQAGIPEEEAQEIYRKYEEEFPEVKVWNDAVIKYARSFGYVKTLAGRRRYLPAIHSSENWERSSAERQAVNTIIQGSAADIMKLGLIAVYKIVMKHPDDIRMLLTVHDEILFEVKEEKLGEYIEAIVPALETAVELDVPLIADFGVGTNWQEAQ